MWEEKLSYCSFQVPKFHPLSRLQTSIFYIQAMFQSQNMNLNQ